MKSFLAWLMSPPRALAQANEEIFYLRGEVRRLGDLLTQAWESSRVIPTQPQHQTAAPQEADSPKTLGQMQREFAEQRVADYEQWLRDEQARQDNIRAINEKPN